MSAAEEEGPEGVESALRRGASVNHLLPRALLAAAAALVCVWVVRRTSWYLAIDQFGYLTFARDLAHGRVFHPWPLTYLLSTLLPAGVPSDVLAQTYIHREGAIFSRYAPGFPLILALVSALFGESAAHLVNPVAVALLLVATYALARHLLESEWLALASALLIILLPNDVLLWSISPLRDVPAHLFALAGLALLASPSAAQRGRLRGLGAGSLLGFAISIRVDAVLYLVSALAIGHLRWRRWWQTWAVAALGLAVGVAPLLAYDWLATGNPFRPTQAVEIDGVVSRADPPADRVPARLAVDLVSRAEAAENAPATPPPAPPPSSAAPSADRFVQGGGLRLRHLPTVLPQNLAALRASLGGLLALCALVGLLTAARTPLLFWATVPYCILSTLVFSCWVRADSRYLAGVLLLLPMLGLYGAGTLVDVCGRLRARGSGAVGWLAAAGVIGLCAWQALHLASASASALPLVSLAIAMAIGLATVVAALGRAGRAAATLQTVLALALVAIFTWRTAANWGGKASFQSEQVARAKATLGQTLPPDALILTSEQIGRPAENINYYMQDQKAYAIYLREIVRWGRYPEFLVVRALRLGFKVFLLLPPAEAEQWVATLSPYTVAEAVAEIPPARAVDVFVASPMHRGLPLQLVRLRIPPDDPWAEHKPQPGAEPKR